uniref:Putative microtubule interacting and transport domain-containing protein n=1 Tax=Phakopsora pachyrhizi TaxID=170000 RepID=I6UM80_PHAPC|nr:putative microtubule interacting and transport domain-containing protein [Phakopsora pachyrhizi]
MLNIRMVTQKTNSLEPQPMDDHRPQYVCDLSNPDIDGSNWSYPAQQSDGADSSKTSSTTDPRLIDSATGSSYSTSYLSSPSPRSISSSSQSSDSTTSPSTSNRLTFAHSSWSTNSYPSTASTDSQHSPKSRPDSDRKSFSSDCTAREPQINVRRSLEVPFCQNSPESLKPRVNLQTNITSPNPSSESTILSLNNKLNSSIARVSLEVLDEATDNDSQNLSTLSTARTSITDSNPLPDTDNTRSRSSSSNSGASILSHRGRVMSTESMATSMRTSISSVSYKPDQSLPPIPQTPTRFESGEVTYPSLSPRNRTLQRGSILSQTSDPPKQSFSRPSLKSTSISSINTRSFTTRPEIVTPPLASPKPESIPNLPSGTRLPSDSDPSSLPISSSSSSNNNKKLAPISNSSRWTHTPSPLNDTEPSLKNDAGAEEEETGTVSIIQSSRLSSLTNSSRPLSVVRRTSNVSIAPARTFPPSSMRMRAYSQPGKRPGFNPLTSNEAPPPLPSQSALGTSPSPSSPSPVARPNFSGVYSMSRNSSAPITSSTAIANAAPSNNLSPIEAFIPKSAGPIPTFQLRATSPTKKLNVELPLNGTLSLSPPSGRLAVSGVNTGTSNAFVYGIQPYPHATTRTGSVVTDIPGGMAGPRPYPHNPTRRPFHLMKQIKKSISVGGYVSARLYVPKQMWCQTGIKLHGLETKIKLMEALINGLDLVERDGESLVGGQIQDEADGVVGAEEEIADGEGRGDGLEDGEDENLTVDERNKLQLSTRSSARVLDTTERFMKRLEAFEELIEGAQGGIAKKLGFSSNGSQETAYGQNTMKKGSGLGTLMAQKLGKGFDRITNGRNTVDPSAIYVETISKLFEKSQVIDVHLASLDRANNALMLKGKSRGIGIVKRGGSEKRIGLYEFVGPQSKSQIEGRLRKVPEFYSMIVCRFVVADMGVLLDKYVKRAGSWCGD